MSEKILKLLLIIAVIAAISFYCMGRMVTHDLNQCKLNNSEIIDNAGRYQTIATGCLESLNKSAQSIQWYDGQYISLRNNLTACRASLEVSP